MKTILVTGGTGFIGSHTSILLLQNNYRIIIIDNLVNSKSEVFQKIKKITNKNDIKFYVRDLCNDNIDDIFINNNIDAVIHFAGLKSVSESVKDPILYYETNIKSTLNVIKVMEKYNVENLIFSSSATVYGESQPPLYEISEIGKGITNPYGQTKYIIENILNDFAKANKNFKIIILRYFNPIGAHPSGLLGENPNNIPNNLMPYVLKVAHKNNIDNSSEGYDYLSIFGNDYDTPDGTCIRDYIHVMDLAESHVLSINNLSKLPDNYNIFNVGLGKGTSVLNLLKIFEKVNNVKVPYKIVGRRPGDLPIVYCNINKVQNYLNFEPKYNIEDMCKDSWNYMINHNL